MILVVIPFFGSSWATTDLSTLGSPDVTISPTSGPPGSKITITVSNIPDISKEAYPYPDLYIYLPFSKPFGTTVTSHCGGEDCFPIYTHDNALNHDFANRTVTFSLFSTSNPNPVFLNGFENSVCDVVVNGKIIERFSTLCNTKNEPVDTYEIRLAWELESDLEQAYTVKTVQFTVTPGSQPSPLPVAEKGNLIIKQFQNGTISKTQFESKLRELGWNDEQIRQALAVMGKLPHQMGSFGPDSTQEALQDDTQNNTNKTSSLVMNGTETKPTETGNITQLSEPTTLPILPKINYSEQNRSHNIEQNGSSTIQQNDSPSIPRNSLFGNIVIIGLSAGAAVSIAGAVFIIKRTRKGMR